MMDWVEFTVLNNLIHCREIKGRLCAIIEKDNEFETRVYLEGKIIVNYFETKQIASFSTYPTAAYSDISVHAKVHYTPDSIDKLIAQKILNRKLDKPDEHGL